MFSNLEINNYRSFTHFTISELSRVNLFFGKNNCGKTSLLEAILILSGMTNPEILPGCNVSRSFRYIKDFSYFFNKLDLNSSIQISSYSQNSLYNRSLSIEYTELPSSNNVRLTENFSMYPTANIASFNDALLFYAKINDEIFKSKIIMKKLKNSEKIAVSRPRAYQERLICNYIPSRYLYETNADEVSNLFTEKQEYLITESLRLIDPRIRDFVLYDDEIMVDIGLNNRIPLNFLGDGVRKFFSIVVALYNARNGVLLIDEIDNGLHFSAMKNLWNIVISVAEMFNVQVFATTHNIDSLKGLSATIDESSSVSLYKILKKDEDRSIALHYNPQAFQHMIFSETEIR